jgi:hypothetical protein
VATPRRGDVVIRHSTSSDFQLVDAVSEELIATSHSLVGAIDLAAARGGAVWRQNLDQRGRAVGLPLLLLPRSRSFEHDR